MNARAGVWFGRERMRPGWSPRIPAHALAEIAGAVARQTGDTDQGVNAASRVSAMPGIQIVPVDAELGEMAANLAAHLRLRGADAIYVAVALRHEVPLVTFDTQLAERSFGIVEVIVP